MEKSFLQRQAEYIFRVVYNYEFVDKITDIFRFPNITLKQISEILLHPDTEAELKLANAVLDLSMTFSEYKEILNGESFFNPEKNDGYDYLDYGISMVLEDIIDLKERYNLSDPESAASFLSELNNTILSVANDARQTSTEKYHQLCCDVNMTFIPMYAREVMKKLFAKEEALNFIKDDDNVISKQMLIIANAAYLSQALFIGDKNLDEGSKNDLEEEDLELAYQFTERFNSYVQSLSQFTRN